MSRKLMHYVTLELDRYDNIEDEAFAFYYDVDPVKILKRSYKLATADMRKTVRNSISYTKTKTYLPFI
jgi:hypothetical protein